MQPNGLEGIVEQILFSEQIQVERKTFSFELRENPRGQFLRITEDVGGRRDTVIVPAPGLARICEVIGRAMAVAGPMTMELEGAAVN
jgi:hypothetical protein